MALPTSQTALAGQRIELLAPLDNWRARVGWRTQRWGDGRPLYRLPKLVAAPDGPVLVVEDERKADCAATLFPDLAVVAPMNGAKSPAKTDWSPLRGRDVTICPDNDAPGCQFAQAVAALAADAGAASVAIVRVPDHFPEKWDLADPPAEDWGEDDLRCLLNTA